MMFPSSSIRCEVLGEVASVVGMRDQRVMSIVEDRLP